MFEVFYCNMVRQNLVLPYLPQKWHGNCLACRTGGAAHVAEVSTRYKSTAAGCEAAGPPMGVVPLFYCLHCAPCYTVNQKYKYA